ncbi:MAG: GGDEF domain-containing protein, partial [Gammaproteobacteria bacterium]|nr:GGDEF domain-containing protein [Gammaproteobacteria bacterium]
LLFDTLTGAGSRLSYDETLERELARWQRYGDAFSYAILDIDHFKKINDKYGHSAGDKALQIVVRMMMGQIRKTDSIFRIGGEEFVLLLPNTSPDKANGLVKKLRENLARSSIHCKQQPVTLTLSAGITAPLQGDVVKSLYERADKALYRAKNSGRNCQFIS